MKIKKLLSVLLSIILIISIYPLGVFEFTASAETVSGTCGTNVTWEYDTETYTLTISGTGAMSNYYAYYPNYIFTVNTPWWQQYRYSIKTLVINNGVTSIGENAFRDCSGITSVTIPDSVTTIGKLAFYNCSGLKSVTIGFSVTSIGDQAFDERCMELESVHFHGTRQQWIDKGKITIGEKNSSTAFANKTYCTYDTWFTRIAPTCTETGIEYATCPVCGTEATRNANALGHSFTNYISNNDATCTQDGTKTAKCDRCNVTDTVKDTGSKLGHDYINKAESVYFKSAANCTHGNIYYKSCLRCGVKSSETFENGEPLGHNYNAVVTDPTCTAQGYATYTCSRCGDSYIDNYTNAIGHDWSEWAVTIAATCTTKGEEIRICANDVTHKQTRDIPALGHSFTNYISNNDATCAKDGTKTARCDRCNATDTVTDVGSKLGHNYKTVVTDPTCTAYGYTTHTCTRCGNSYVDSYVSVIGHSWGKWAVTTAATCTEKGVETRVCANDASHKQTRDIPALGHSFTNYISNNDATCTADGTKTAKCDRCNATDTVTDVGTKLAHNYVNTVDSKYLKTAADCTHAAVYYKSCSSCGSKSNETFEHGAPLGHDYVAGSTGLSDIPDGAVEFNNHWYFAYNIASINTWEAAKEFCNQKNGYLATITSAEENQFLYDYVRNVAGYRNAYFGLTDKDNEGVWVWNNGEEFVYSNWQSGQPDNYAGNENYGMYYSGHAAGKWNDGNFGEYGTVFICEWSERAAVVAPTCTTQGYTTYVCSRCGDSYVDDYTDALGHTGGAATCHSKAICERCGEEYGEIDLSNHDGGTEIINAKVATCTKNGYTGDVYCLGCGEKIENGKSIVAAGHTPTDWIIDKHTSHTEAGIKHKECSVCGEILEVVEIPVIGPTTQQIVIESKKSTAGKTVDIKISIKNNPGIASLKLKVAYDSDLTLIGIAYNDEIGGNSQQPQTLNSPVVINWFNGEADSNGDFVFATLTFKVDDNATVGNKSITATYNPDDVYNIDENNIDLAITGGNIEVISYIPGDINGDDKVNNKDLTRLFQYLSEWDVTVNEAALDVNGDGKVNNKDLTRLFQYLSEWNVEIF